MNIKDLLRYRNHLSPKLLPIADWLIHRHFKHIPVLNEFFRDPPPQQPLGRRPRKMLATECALEIIRIQISEELEKREQNAPYMGGLYRRRDRM